MKRTTAQLLRVCIVVLVFSLQACAARGERIPLTTEPDMQKKALNPEFQQVPAGLNTYVIGLELDFAAHSYTGEELLVYQNSESVALGALNFRLFPNGHRSFGTDGQLNVTNIRVDGKQAKSRLALDDSVLEITLPEQIPPGKAARVEMDFSGSVPTDDMQSSDQYAYGFFNLTQDDLTLVGWFPLLAVYDSEGWNLDRITTYGDSTYSDTALFDVTVTTESRLKMVSTGTAVSTETHGARASTRIVSGPVRDFALAVSPNFEVQSEQIGGGITVNSYTLPGDRLGGADVLLSARSAVNTFNQKFGGYPYTELDVVETPLSFDGGIEYPGLILISQKSYQSSQGMSGLIAHEVAHQWWYGVVGNDQVDDPWLDEALATYSTAVFMETKYGPQAYQGMLADLKSSVANLSVSQAKTPVTAGVFVFEDSGSFEGYSAIVYNKGALFFDALRSQVGDDLFYKALSTYYQEYFYKTVRTQDLLQVFNSVSGQKLDGVFQQWLTAP